MDGRWLGTRKDYDRALGLPEALRGKVFHGDVEPHWSEDSSRFWYLREMPPPAGPELHFVDCRASTRYVDGLRLLQTIAKRLGVENVRPILAAFVEGAPHLVRVRAESDFGQHWFLCDVHSYCVDIEPAMDEPEFEPSLVPTMISTSAGVEIQLLVVNSWTSPVTMYWVDTEGKSHRYAAIAAGGEASQRTYEGHVWKLVSDKSNNVVAWYRGSSRNERVELIRPNALETSELPAAPTQTDPFNLVHDGVPLTTDGHKGLSYSGAVVCPNKQFIASFRTHAPENPRQLTLLEMAATENGALLPASRVQTHEYLKPGDPMPYEEPVLVEIATKRVIAVQSPELFAGAYGNSQWHWHPSGDWCFFLHDARGHKVQRIVAVHCRTGQARVMLEETSVTFIDHPKTYLKYLAASNELLWSSERSGYRHLYLYALPSRFDALDRLHGFPLTQGDFVVKGVESIDTAKRTLTLAVRGYHRDMDPYYVHFLRLDLATRALTLLSTADATHDAPRFSPDGTTYLMRYSRVDLAPVVELRRSADGALLLQVESADVAPLLATGWQPPLRFSALARDGATRIYGIAVLPTHAPLAPPRPFRVVEHIYAGPHSAFVPKAWGLIVAMQQLAELGFVVVQIDGMGTAQRSKAFHDVCYQNLADAGLPDRVLWLRAFAAAHPQLVDLRGGVGIYGGSAGGQSAVAALLTQGDMYAVAVADCGCHDNRVDKLWWNELFMGYPVTDCYAANANVALVHRMESPRQKLLLTVGLLDTNVDPASTLQLAQALIDADKDFEILPFPRLGHGAAESAYGKRKRMDFFVRHLLRSEPRAEYAV
ncbi:hypothetical protein ACHHYP_16117 [Achlya hypogyna]|uniref:Dipeptidyl peptidase n=1 Tax=Achlya hypogyna TaxID=1202772 RepID=A0A1V9Y9J0_ACHHY|nr:hypothetical protein ACHHYP_16117 [Achlya hypogyna]